MFESNRAIIDNKTNTRNYSQIDLNKISIENFWKLKLYKEHLNDDRKHWSLSKSRRNPGVFHSRNFSQCNNSNISDNGYGSKHFMH